MWGLKAEKIKECKLTLFFFLFCFHSTHCFLWAIFLQGCISAHAVCIRSNFQLWVVQYKAQLLSFFISLSMNGSLNLRVLQLIGNVITLSPFFFRTLIFQVNKQTSSNIEACGIWLITHFQAKVLPYPLYLSQSVSYHAKESYFESIFTNLLDKFSIQYQISSLVLCTSKLQATYVRNHLPFFR